MTQKPASPPAPPSRLSIREFLRDVGDELFRGDRGLPWTLWQLLHRPGWAIRRYLETRDARLTRPFRLALFCLATAALILHLAGALDSFRAGFVAGVMGAEGGSLASSPLQQAGSQFLGRFDLVLVLCWLPAVAGAVQRAYPRYALNFAEAFVFGLYSLSLAVLLFTPLLLLSIDARLWLLLAFAVPLAAIGHSAFGYARPEGHGLARALGTAVLAMVYIALLLAMVLGVWIAALSLGAG